LGDLLDRLGYQDVVSFTGSAQTALMLRSNPHLLENSVRFIAEQDSLNASMLGPDATPDSPEFDILVKEAVREITAKAGQKCTAIRRIMVPEALLGPVGDAIAAKLATIRIGDPALETTRMGALASAEQKSRCSRQGPPDLRRMPDALGRTRTVSRWMAQTRPGAPSWPRCCLPATIPMRRKPCTRSRPSARWQR
jgi:acyl-CoA reductase-like NAD-dependent aldehyde dehydrogenase